MKSGIIERHELLRMCDCGFFPDLIWHYIKGTANHVNYFVKCKNCRMRTTNRKNQDGAIKDWNDQINITKDGIKKEDCMTLVWAHLVHPENGYDCDKESVKKLSPHVNYPVKEISMGQSHTSFTVEGIQDSFNSVQFEFLDKDFKEIDIFAMPEFNPYLDPMKQ